MSGPKKHNLDPSLQIQLVPPGGTDNQILIKLSPADHDMAWADASQAGQDKQYTHDQMVASAIWVVTHNLSKYPSVTVIDTGGTIVVGEIEYNNLNAVTLRFSAEFSGKAYLN